jgi:aarF domain-containing kinase
MQAAVMPKPYTEAFANIFDAAPECSYAEIEGVFLKEFGKRPEEVFASFDKKSIAAASIAQVHRATLTDGTVVAVKVQRPSIPKQIEWDLMSFKLLMRAYEWLFEIPCVFMADCTWLRAKLVIRH